jgi:hypothetical protein
VRVELLEQFPLDEHYLLARARSRMRFAKPAQEMVELASESTYVLLVKDDQAKIVFFTTHDDLVAVMREHGLLPAA